MHLPEPVKGRRRQNRTRRMSTTPVSLLQRLHSQPDETDWSRFVELYTPLIYYWVCQMGFKDADAADLMQDIFLLLLDKLPRFEYQPERSFRAWLRVVCQNRCRDFLRRKPHVAHGPLVDDLPDNSPDAASVWDEQEYRRHLVGRALELMQHDFQPTTWQACWRHVVEGKSAIEVGRELGITANAVYLAKSRVLRRLRGELDGLLM